MKNILKKLGGVSLILAVLAPFLELPKVDAADPNCTSHLQNYLFLDKNTLYLIDGNETIFEKYSSSNEAAGDTGGSQTYTHFPYAFVNQAGQAVTVTATDKNTFNNTNKSTGLTQYWNYFNNVRTSLASYKDANKLGAALIKDSTLFSGNYTDNTILLHGTWSSYDADGRPILSKWEGVTGGKDYSIQDILSQEDLEKFDVTINAAKFYDNEFVYANTTANADYLQSVVNNGVNLWKDGNNNQYIPLSITRTIDLTKVEIETMLNKYIFGYNDGDTIYVFTQKDTTDLSTINDSYSTLKAFLRFKKDNSNPTAEQIAAYTATSSSWDEEKLDFNLYKSYYWPVVFSVEYKSCSTVSGQWVLKYDDNVPDTSVTNMPELSQKEALGTPIVVSSTIPSRKNYKFTGWCETEKGSGSCYTAGKSVPSPNEPKTITLFAQWAEEGPGDQKKYGVMSYVLGFVAVGIVAGGIYLISKKKNLFKQI